MCKLVPIPGQAREGSFPKMNKKESNLNPHYGILHVASEGDQERGTVALRETERFIPVACLKPPKGRTLCLTLGHSNVKSENVCRSTFV